ncbi:MAG TPA: DUF58 domain-containing protein [Firmicutes bacterium]|nr:DUF58 domain-containing protein [Bacillota bacterium]
MKLVFLVVLIYAIVSLQAYIFKKYSFQDLDYSYKFDRDEVFEGENFSLVETIKNNKILPLPWLRSDITASKWLEFGEANAQAISDDTRIVSSFFTLGGYKAVTRTWNVNCTKRGEFEIKKAHMVSSDLFGQAKISKGVEVSYTVLVLPNTVDLEEMFILPRYLQGDTITKRQIAEDPFYISGVREYTDRDPMNSIHWAATAKEQKLMVRNYEYTSQQSLTILLNIKSQEIEYGEIVHPDLVEGSIRVCASLLSLATEEGIPVNLYANAPTDDMGTDITATNMASGNEHAMDLLRILAKIRMKSVCTVTEFFSYVDSAVSGTDLAIVTPYLDTAICNYARDKMYNNVHVQIYLTNFVEQKEIPDDLEIYIIKKEFVQKTQESPEDGDAA